MATRVPDVQEAVNFDSKYIEITIFKKHILESIMI